MPVNMDPKKRRHGPPAGAQNEPQNKEASEKPWDPFAETEQDREKALADAESKNLWDATEVIDMDTW
jgi:hypothetical protein